jgi:hypothetical protein
VTALLVALVGLAVIIGGGLGFLAGLALFYWVIVHGGAA